MKPMTPRPLEWIDIAPVRASRSRRIAVPADTVWAAIADHEGWTAWFPNLTRVEPGEQDHGVGGTRTVHVGNALSAHEEFVAWEPGSRFSFTLVAASQPGLRSMNEDVRITPDGPTACTVTYTMGIDLPGARALRPVLAPVLRKVIGDGLAGLAMHVGG
jgi:uncharacterized protein YndB with AHSA1/START domain